VEELTLEDQDVSVETFK